MPKSFRIVALLLATAFLSVSVAPAMAVGASIAVSAAKDSGDDEVEKGDESPRLTKEQRKAQREAKEAEQKAKELLEKSRPKKDSIALPPIVIRPSKPAKPTQTTKPTQTSKPAKPATSSSPSSPKADPSLNANPASVGSPVSAINPPNTSVSSGSAATKVNPEPATGTANVDQVATEPSENVNEPSTQAIDPGANVPVELSSLQPSKKTPADVFVESATVGVGAMAVGAMALGAVAVTRGAKSRREKNAEYLYSSEN